jgi:hypothetical protein
MRLVRPVVVLALALVAPLAAFPGMAQAAGPVRAVSQPATAQPAQQPDLPPTLLPLLTQPGHQAALLEAAHAVDIPGVPPCPDANYATSGEIGVLDPPRLNAQGKIISGAWKEAILETGCGTTRRLNALTEVSPDGSLETRALLPGNTITDPELQEDSVQFAAAGMGELPPDCDQGGIVDTKFVGLDGQPVGVLPSPTAPPRPWSEIWTLQACSKRTDVVMHFVPDATGTSIHAALATK